MPDEVVADASALVKMLTDSTPEAFELGRRLSAAAVHAPHLIDAEVGDVLRRQVLRGEVEADTALTSLMTLEDVVDERYPHAGPLTRDAWKLRDRVRFYDALYVALAARLKLPLVTADAKLGRAHNLPCAVEVVSVEQGSQCPAGHPHPSLLNTHDSVGTRRRATELMQ